MRKKRNNDKLKIILFISAIVIVLLAVAFGISKIKVDDFHKASVIFVVDASASNQKDLPKQTAVLKQLCSMLDPDDQIKILRVSESSYIIYEGSPQSTSEIRKAMKKFTQYDKHEYGTAYGLSLKKAFNHSLNLYKEGYIPSVVVIGDLADEGNPAYQINWNTFPSDVSQMVKETDGKFSMMFLYASPEKLDFVKEKLNPVLGEQKLIIGNETAAARVLSRFLAAIGR